MFVAVLTFAEYWWNLKYRKLIGNKMAKSVRSKNV